MFITVTIQTTRKKSLIKMKKSKIHATNSWRKPMLTKKRSFWDKFIIWHKAIKDGQYELDGQTAMF